MDRKPNDSWSFTNNSSNMMSIYMVTTPTNINDVYAITLNPSAALVIAYISFIFVGVVIPCKLTRILLNRDIHCNLVRRASAAHTYGIPSSTYSLHRLYQHTPPWRFAWPPSARAGRAVKIDEVARLHCRGSNCWNVGGWQQQILFISHKCVRFQQQETIKCGLKYTGYATFSNRRRHIT